MTTWLPGDILLLPELTRGSRLWAIIDLEQCDAGDTVVVILESLTKAITCRIPLELLNRIDVQVIPSHDKLPPSTTHSGLLKLATAHGWQGDIEPLHWLENVLKNFERLLTNA